MGSGLFLACVSAFLAKVSDRPWEWYMIPIALFATVGLFFVVYGFLYAHKSEVLLVMNEGTEATMFGREAYYFLTIINQSQDPIEVTHVWVELNNGNVMPVADSVSHLPVVIPQHATWKTKMMKLRLPVVNKLLARGRAQLLDGRILRSSPGKAQPYARVHTRTL
jgi:hypothetical protein